MADALTSGVLLKHAAAPQALAAVEGLEPILTSVSGQAGSPGVAGAGHWSRLAVEGEGPRELWARCHELVRDGLGAAPVGFAEPDLVQRWTFETPGEMALAATRPCSDLRGPDPATPTLPDPYWFRDAKHSEFGSGALGKGARIAHLDTGFDPTHSTKPRRVRTDLQKNYVDRDRPDDAADTAGGLVSNPGHGPATLALLAGGPYGGAPEAEVIPFRVADSVVLFSNSSVARALDEVHRLTVSGAAPVDVVTMSMGGIASQAWAEAVNALYEAGVFVVTAAGNNFGNLPTRFIVYPARFRRVVAACGVMANHHPYADLPLKVMAGNYGPKPKMATAVAAATPNVPWARLGCPATVDGHGGGTSAATPQVAAAAARWIAQHRARLAALPEPWMRVEAVRHALFTTARPGDAVRLGHGELRADAALAVRPAAGLARQDRDTASLGILRILTGLGVAALSDTQLQMLELEALQISQRGGVEAALDDWDKAPEDLTPAEVRRLAEAIADQPEASPALREALAAGQPRPVAGARLPLPRDAAAGDPMARHHLQMALDPQPPTPTRRRLRAYAYDPVLSGRMGGWAVNEAALSVRWEPLTPGPVGEYLEVVDVDPASGCAYAPVDLDDPRLVAGDGFSPNEGNPQFHQQMVYAVASKTIEHFERALGRVALWAPRFEGSDTGVRQAKFVRRLRLYPHALREENAYYSPAKSALLFGYFQARASDTGEVLPGGQVFSCLSHDIVAHETTHALLDGLHRYYREPSNPDALAFHEAFADLVALFQHFTVPEALRGEIAKTRGDLSDRNMLAELAVQFGQGAGRHGALRDAIGQSVRDAAGRTVWVRREPAAGDYEASAEPHARGAVLVSAVFDAFLAVYQARSADLIRLATGGTGVLPPGAIPVDLTNRLADEAACVAGEVLQMCIRALDYCPPVDLTFGDYLRALITADRDVAGEARREHRVAMVAAFRARGIYPAGVRTLSAASIAWEPPPIPLDGFQACVEQVEDQLRDSARATGRGPGERDLTWWSLAAGRDRAWAVSRKAAALFRARLRRLPAVELAVLGLHARAERRFTLAGETGALELFEVQSVRPARRIDEEGRARTDLVIEVTQAWRPAARPWLVVRGGVTILFDLEERRVRYLVRKRLDGPGFAERQLGFRLAGDPLRENYFDAVGEAAEPFAMLHRRMGG